MKYKIGIAGIGMVGEALSKIFKNPILYDKYKDIGSIKELNKADIIFICVPTLTIQNTQDISSLEEIINQINNNKIIVIKSTILPGTVQLMQEKYPKKRFLFNPEFLTEESADQDIKYPDRQIVGYTKQSYTIAGDILNLLPQAPVERIVKSEVAEFIKYYGNCWFAVKVAYNNQMYDLAQEIGFDNRNWEDIIDCISADKRIGRSHLEIWHKGFRGYGGKCLPKDTKALITFGKERGVSMSILRSINDYNDKLLEQQRRDKDR